MVVFQALTWEARDDDETQRHVVSIIGKTAEGRSVCVSTNYDPYFFFLKLPAGATARDALETFQAIERACPEDTEMESYTVVHATDVWGFSNMEKVPFLRLNFKNLESRKAAARVLRYQRLELAAGVRDAQIYESNIDPVLRLMHETGIEATGWLDTGDECEEDTRALVDIDVWCDDWRSLAPVSRDDVAPFVVASFDIECYSSTGKFPNPEVADDACFQIAISLCRFGSDEPYKKTCLCFKTTDANLEGVEIASFDTERDLLYAFKRFLHDESVDIITGWNIFGFDLAFIHERAIRHCDVDFFELGRLRDDLCHIVKKKLSSSALGDNELKLLPMSGRFTFDMFHEVKKNYKLDSYKLDAVSRKYLDGDSKIDMPPRGNVSSLRARGSSGVERDRRVLCERYSIAPKTHEKVVYAAQSVGDGESDVGAFVVLDGARTADKSLFAADEKRRGAQLYGSIPKIRRDTGGWVRGRDCARRAKGRVLLAYHRARFRVAVSEHHDGS